MVVIALKEHELPSIPGDRAAAERGCRCGGRPPSVTVRSPHAPGPPGTTRETHVDERGRRSQRSRTRRWRGRASVPAMLPPAREPSAPIRWSSRAVLSSAVVHDRARDSARIAEDVPQKGRQAAQRTDAGDSAGADVLDAPEHAARRLRASVEMKYERSLRRKLERYGTWDLIRQRSVSLALP